MELFNLSGKKAVITGANQGLGKGMAEALHEAGAEVVIIDVNSNVFNTAEEIGKTKPNIFAIQADLSVREELNNSFEVAVEKLGGSLDIMINAAGIASRTKSEDFPTKDWDRVIEVNLSAVFFLCQLAGKIMLKQKSGKIINIASMLSFFGGYTVAAYAASKGGVAQITKALSNEWARYGININAIAPGYMNTSLNKNLINDPVRNKEILDRIPAGRWGLPEDMKGIAIFLSSKASDYLNGAVIPVDGGYLGR